MSGYYDKASVESIYIHADKLTGHSLYEVSMLKESLSDDKNKGSLGTLVEKIHFQHNPPNVQLPDFPDASLELKTTGVIRDKKSNEFREKERLSLTQINYIELEKEEWHSSKFLRKCNLLLLLFYEYEREVPEIRRKFVIPPLILQITSDERTISFEKNSKIRFLKLPDRDVAQIKRDWEKIQSIVRASKAHELSEGDTFYLAASRKGSGGVDESLRKQAGTSELAKSRAFAFKPSYLRQIINSHLEERVDLGVDEGITFEEALRQRLEPYFGMTVDEISQRVGYSKKSKNHKNFYRGLINRAISQQDSEIMEHEKAGIEIKTVRLLKSGKPKESMSFPAFNPLEIVNQSWEDSEFYSKLNKKFLLVVFQERDERLVFKFAKYWNMPFQDRSEAKRVWEEAKRCVFADVRPYPRIVDNEVAHVRPHAKNKQDVSKTPQGKFETKQGFWLNASYIANVVKELG